MYKFTLLLMVCTLTSCFLVVPDRDPCFFTDSDGDGYTECGSRDRKIEADCDDSNPSVHPGADEICDGMDNNCDGFVDSGRDLVGGLTYFVDLDADGYGRNYRPPDDTMPFSKTTCTQPDGYVLVPGDCDDNVAEVKPGADEICDGVDNNCDGVVDEPEAIDAKTWYIDTDGDDYGNSEVSQKSCTKPSGYVADNTDCDDSSKLYHPGATEDDCTDPNDYNCDGSTGFADADEDGFAACKDCNDNAEAINPDADEVCDEIDNNCDGTADEPEAVDAKTWYRDSDRDRYGDKDLPKRSCKRPAGYVVNDDDCDDTDKTVHPGATEVCNDVDDDCDMVVDDGLDFYDYYTDVDVDGYGDANDTSPTSACKPVTGKVTDNTDCDDKRKETYPGADEYCNKIDDDCDKVIDEDDAVDTLLWYADVDKDGYGSSKSLKRACSIPSGYVADATDCDDGDANTFPGVASLDNVSDCMTDDDGDEYGDASPKTGVTAGTDCDDDEKATYPGALEVVSDSVDQDCDSVDSCYSDVDGDGYGGVAAIVIDDSNLDCSDKSKKESATADDCNDSDKMVYPGATEVCNDVDDDCDTVVDDGLPVKNYYIDFDGDSYGDVDDASPTSSCKVVSGKVLDNTDCDDTDKSVHTGEIWYLDDDGDGYGDPAEGLFDCPSYFTSDYVADKTDCDDMDVEVNPGATPDPYSVGDKDCSGKDDKAGQTVVTDSGTFVFDALAESLCVDKEGDCTFAGGSTNWTVYVSKSGIKTPTVSSFVYSTYLSGSHNSTQFLSPKSGSGTDYECLVSDPFPTVTGKSHVVMLHANNPGDNQGLRLYTKDGYDTGIGTKMLISKTVTGGDDPVFGADFIAIRTNTRFVACTGGWTTLQGGFTQVDLALGKKK